MTSILAIALVVCLIVAVNFARVAQDLQAELEHSHTIVGDLTGPHQDLRTRLRSLRALLWDDVVDLHPYRLDVHRPSQPAVFRVRARSYTWALGLAPLLAEWGGPETSVALYRDGPDHPVLLGTFTHDSDGHVQWHPSSSPDSAGFSGPVSVTCTPSGRTPSPATMPSVGSPTFAT